MSLAEEYRRQFSWRAWTRILSELPSLTGARVLDVGCGPGDLSAELCARGATVVGVDTNEELLEATPRIPGARFVKADLRSRLHFPETFDGIWSSFSAAYFPALSTVLENWAHGLRPGGWIALVEVDDLFGHEPLPADVQQHFAGYVADAFEARRYDFHMGSKLELFLRVAGFTVQKSFSVIDRELAFEGPASAEVVEAWRGRLDRLQLLRDRCGEEFPRVRDAFLQTLSSADHHSTASVRVCVATR